MGEHKQDGGAVGEGVGVAAGDALECLTTAARQLAFHDDYTDSTRVLIAEDVQSMIRRLLDGDPLWRVHPERRGER